MSIITSELIQTLIDQNITEADFQEVKYSKYKYLGKIPIVITEIHHSYFVEPMTISVRCKTHAGVAGYSFEEFAICVYDESSFSDDPELAPKPIEEVQGRYYGKCKHPLHNQVFKLVNLFDKI